MTDSLTGAYNRHAIDNFKSLNDTYGHAYLEALNKLRSIRHAECVYHWIHPSKGEIAIRAVAQGNTTDNDTKLYGYMREVKDEDIVFSYDDAQWKEISC